MADKGGGGNEWTGWIVARFNLRVDDEFPPLCEEKFLKKEKKGRKKKKKTCFL